LCDQDPQHPRGIPTITIRDSERLDQQATLRPVYTTRVAAPGEVSTDVTARLEVTRRAQNVAPARRRQ